MAKTPSIPAVARTRKALLLVNPHARRGAVPLDAVQARLAAAGIETLRENFSGPGEAAADLRRLSPGADLVILCGGDGTLNAAAPALIETGLPLGILPMGTANDLARTLGIPDDLAAAADIIAAGQIRGIDLGCVNGHPYFNVASLGLSGDLAATLDKNLKRRFGKLGYALAAFRVLARARPFRAMIITRNGATRVRTLQIAVGNGRHYGGGNIVEESAAIDDGTLDLYSLELGSVWKLAMMARDFRLGSHGAWREVRTERCTEFEVRTRKPMPVNCDGELVTSTPARFSILRNAVRVFAPAEVARLDR
jgi:diacylglycerol kinase (ATP)